MEAQASQPGVASASQDSNVGNMSASDLASVIASGVSAGVTSSMNEITAKINQMMDSVSENVKKQSQSDDRSLSTEVTGTYDVYENMRRNDTARDRIQVQAEIALANAVELAKAVSLRSLDHFSSLPPVSAKVSGC